MFKKDALKRYSLFLNEITELIMIGAKVNVGELTEKYGVSPSFFSFLIKNGTFKKDPQHKGYYTSSLRDYPTIDQVGALKNSYNLAKYSKKRVKSTLPSTSSPPRPTEAIRMMKVDEFVDELMRRGWTGKISRTETIEF